MISSVNRATPSVSSSFGRLSSMKIRYSMIKIDKAYGLHPQAQAKGPTCHTKGSRTPESHWNGGSSAMALSPELQKKLHLAPALTDRHARVGDRTGMAPNQKQRKPQDHQIKPWVISYLFISNYIFWSCCCNL